MAEEELVRVRRPKKGMVVVLRKYKKYKGQSPVMDEVRLMLVGSKAIIIEEYKGCKDFQGCRMIWVAVDGNRVTWRLSALRIKKTA